MDTEVVTVTLSADLADLVHHQVSSGAFESIEAVIGEALRFWQEREVLRASSLATIRQAIDQAARNPVRISDQELGRRFDQRLVELEAQTTS